MLAYKAPVCQKTSEAIGWEDLLLWYLSCQRVSLTRPDCEELFIVVVYCMYSHHVTDFLINFTFF